LRSHIIRAARANAKRQAIHIETGPQAPSICRPPARFERAVDVVAKSPPQHRTKRKLQRKSKKMKVLVSSGGADAASRTNLGFGPYIIGQQITQSHQAGNTHGDARLHECAVDNRIFLKQGSGVWPYLSEGKDSELMFSDSLKRNVKWSVAEQFAHIAGIAYLYLRHRTYSLFKRVSSIASNARAQT
jgi:hypothetical protein